MRGLKEKLGLMCAEKVRKLPPSTISISMCF
jgi:hypothetical protein